MKTYLVLDNVMKGLFITPTEKSKLYSSAANSRVSKRAETDILSEFEGVQFQPSDSKGSMAESANYIFRRYVEEVTDEIVWVEAKVKG